MLPSVHFQHSFFLTSILAYSFSLLFPCPAFCLPVLLSSFCPISKSPYEPSLLSLKSNAVSFNRSWINSHGFHLPIFFFSPASSLCPPHPSSCLHLHLLCNLLELFFPLLTSHPSAPAPPRIFPALFHLSISWQTICLIYHLASHRVFQSTPTAVVCEHLIYIKIRISLLFPPLSFPNYVENAGVWFFSVVLPLPSMPLPISPGETESQRCGLQKTVVGTYSVKYKRALLFVSPPPKGHEA